MKNKFQTSNCKVPPHLHPESDFQQKPKVIHTFANMLSEVHRLAVVYSSGDKSMIGISIGYGVLIIHLFVFMVRLLFSLFRLDYSLLPSSIPYYIIWIILPPLLYLYSTKIPFYSYHNIKLFCSSVILFNTWLIVFSWVYSGLSIVFLPHIIKIHVDEALTKNMVLILGRIATQLPLIPVGVFLFKSIFYPLLNKSSKEKVLEYKMEQHSKTVQNKDIISYNMNIVRDIKTGRHIPVYTKDRYLHTLLDGTSGTGKTSSTILPAIKDDLNMRCKAEDIQKEKLKELENAGQITYVPPSKCENFSINDFLPVFKDIEYLTTGEITEQLLKIETQIDSLRLDCPVCGITVLAPDDSLTDDVCRLCDARNIFYNRIDAVRDKKGKLKKNCIGLNPFYIPLGLDYEAKNPLIVKKAVIFSDVMQAITDLKGKADSYFTGLNRQMIANIAILVMVTVPILRNRQATPMDLQELINNFDLLPEYIDKLQELDSVTKHYTFIIQYIREDLLGKGRVKMEDQSRGTRNIINEFLLMPSNREIFCSQSSIDFDRALANGEVTVCNYNLASGDSDAVAFGLFFLLSFNNAVLSRPGTENTRIPHFFYLDELPVLIHPSLEKNFSLFRKFRVAMIVAIQTLDQMEKNDITKYLQGVILGCAHIIVFGRSSLTDMKVFSALAGIQEVSDEQSSVTETSLSDSDPHYSFSSKEMMVQKNNLEEIDIRMRDFQEITFFTTQNGRPLPATHGKVDFLSANDWESKQRSQICFQSGSSSSSHLIIKETLPKDDEGIKAPLNYDFLPQTPLSYFVSSKSISPTSAPPPPASDSVPCLSPSQLPEGSETIDDML